MKVKAIVTVTVVITLPDDWSKESEINQVFDQASAKARNIISQHLATISDVIVSKETRVEAVLTES